LKQEENKFLKTAEFAKYTDVSIRTLRHYEEIGILKPSHRTEAGHRLYNFDDYIRMQNIIMLKFIGLSLYDINKIMNENNKLKDCLKIQHKMVEEKIKHFKYVLKTIKEAETIVENGLELNWRSLNHVIKAVNMEKYYSDRAMEYEKIYNRNDSVRQEEQEEIKEKIREVFINKSVLEVASGTGYWTEIISQVATKLTAIDISEETLIEARKKNLEFRNVDFKIADSYRLDKIQGEFNAGCANFWFSHIPKSRIEEFMEGFHKRLGKGSVVFIADNVYVCGIGGELISKHGEVDTYKIRELSNGEKYEILKNYYTEDELKTIFRKYTNDLQVKIGSCFWWIWYIVK
jgi:DNA-binding transcriptional MerR regulator